MIHDMSLAVVVDYYMYLKVAELDLDQTWKDDNIVDFWTFCDILYNQMIKWTQPIENLKVTLTWDLLHIRTHTQKIISRMLIGKKEGGRYQRRLNCTTLQNNSNHKVIVELPISVCVGISHSLTCISSIQKQEISMVIHARSVGRWLTPSVPFVKYTCIWCPTYPNHQEGPSSLTITIMIILIWHVQMQDF